MANVGSDAERPLVALQPTGAAATVHLPAAALRHSGLLRLQVDADDSLGHALGGQPADAFAGSTPHVLPVPFPTDLVVLFADFCERTAHWSADVADNTRVGAADELNHSLDDDAAEAFVATAVPPLRVAAFLNLCDYLAADRVVAAGARVVARRAAACGSLAEMLSHRPGAAASDADVHRGDAAATAVWRGEPDPLALTPAQLNAVLTIDRRLPR